MRSKPSSTNTTAALAAITSPFWPLLGRRIPRSKRPYSNALRSAIVFLLTLLAFSLNVSSSSYAATLTVCASGCNDTTVAAAIAAASAGDTISIQDAVHTETNITVDRNLTIQGQGAANTAVDGASISKSIFTVIAGVTATIKDMTIRNGASCGPGCGGGGIVNYGTLTLGSSTISGNFANNYGGGIFNGGTITIADSTISGNSTSYEGGGIFNESTATISGSTLSGDSAAYGGGIFNAGGTVTIVDSTTSGNSGFLGGGIFNEATATISGSTLSGNSAYYGGGIFNAGGLTINNSSLSDDTATVWGGGVFNEGTTAISFSTFSGNPASQGGGIFNDNASMVVKNSIVGNSPSGGDCFTGGLVPLGANLDTDGSCLFTNFTEVTTAQLNLGPLALNAPGTTKTLALMPGSVAINAAPDCTDVSGNPVTTDQRGVARPDNGETACDIGAFELVDNPQSKSDCKDGNWKLWTDPPFKNQGQCIKFVNHS
jgi:hypothetical protein